MSDDERYEAAGGCKNKEAKLVIKENNDSELTREDRAANRELQRLKLVHEENKLEFEREKARMQHELEMSRLSLGGGSETPADSFKLDVKLKLPTYQDGDDLANFFAQFERVSRLANLAENTYAVRLGSLLSGKAAEIYTTLSEDIANDYFALKNELLRAFNKTADSYRLEFRNMRKEKNETTNQFVTRLGRRFDYWVKNYVTDQSYNDLRDCMILDQLLIGLPASLRVFIKEKGCLSLTETIAVADSWLAAHGNGGFNSFAAGSSAVSTEQNVRGNRDSFNGRSPRVRTDGISNSTRAIKCFNCGEMGHYRSKCPSMLNSVRQVGLDQDSSDPNHEAFVVSSCNNRNRSSKFLCTGSINGRLTDSIMRDSGCSCIVISKEFVQGSNPKQTATKTVSDFLGIEHKLPVHKCFIRCKFFTGWTNAVIAPLKFCSALIGNVEGVGDDSIENVTTPITPGPEYSQCRVVTRAKAKERYNPHPLKLPPPGVMDINSDMFKKKQQTCFSLAAIRKKVDSKEEVKWKDGSQYMFILINGLIYRKCLASKDPNRVGSKALVVPAELRSFVMKVAHDSPMSGHFSHKKTLAKILANFFWPGCSQDVRYYCRSCDICQRVSKKKDAPAPLCKMPIVGEPFSRISLDIVGPIDPIAKSGCRYILTMIDWATGYPEAIPLKHIDSVTIAESLMIIFSRVGIPSVIMSDNGTNFTSKLMGQLHELLGIKPLFSSIYHPQGNGRVERLHATLKSALRKLCRVNAKEWDRYLPAVLFAIREMPSSRTGFSAFELLYGRRVRGPVSIVRELWEDDKLPDDQRDVYKYVVDLKKKLELSSDLACENAKLSQAKFSHYFDLKSKNRELSVGDEVLILLPDTSNKLLVSWKGPFRVQGKINRVNYSVATESGLKTYHINLLKRYYRRLERPDLLGGKLQSNAITVAHAQVIDEGVLVREDYVEASRSDELDISPKLGIKTRPSKSEESTPVICHNLSEIEQSNIAELCEKFSATFSNVPGYTETVTHRITLLTTEPIRSKVYPIPVHLQDEFNTEVDKLLTLGIIQRSTSDYCSPPVMVKKSDGSYRLAIDFRALNQVTRLDAEPPFDVEGEFHKFSGCRYFSEIDITKAYHQVNLEVNSRKYTAFPTARGLMEYVRLPFGAVSACATYARLMRIVLDKIEGVTFFFDNILVFSKSWVEHLDTLNHVLERLQKHGLTVNPSKCKFGFSSINYLGFVVSGQFLAPQEEKTRVIKEVCPPQTKKGLRSFLGFVSFYRKFVPNMATITARLTDKLKKPMKEPIQYNEEDEKDFQKLKGVLTSNPVLKIPNLKETFVVRSDSSDVGLGAVLLQYFESIPHPVSFASRKLLPAEKNYSTIEKECLAIVFAIKKFSAYLLGKAFVLETDHRPLVYLTKMRNMNSRIARWALMLQPYQFSIVYIPGPENLGADYLSRNF